MAKRTTSGILVMLTTVLMVMSFAIPHHHHGENSTICLSSDCSCNSSECANEHSHDPADNCSQFPADDAQKTADGSCCGLKSNLLIHAGDSRRVSFQSHCGSDDDPLHNGLNFDLLAIATDIPTPADKLPLWKHPYPPIFISFRSIQPIGSAGLRAPPIA